MRPGVRSSRAAQAGAIVAAILGAAILSRCRVCGCTDLDCSQCIAATGRPGSWAEPDLCSRCA